MSETHENKPNNVFQLNSSSGTESVLIVGPNEFLIKAKLMFSDQFQFWGLLAEESKEETIESISEKLNRSVSELGLKRITLLGVGWGGPAIIHYAANNLKNVRRIAFLDAVSRPKQLFMETVLETVEKILPLGLPFRPLSKTFDPRPIIHRVRCPALVLSSELTSAEVQEHSDFLLQRLPNAWYRKISNDALIETLESFVNVPTKQPQKNLNQEMNGVKPKN